MYILYFDGACGPTNPGGHIGCGVAIKDKDKIMFYRKDNEQLRLATDTYEPYNSYTWWIGIKTYDIILFPSSLTHSVEPVTSDETRISLAFNSFIKGVLGNNSELTELINE